MPPITVLVLDDEPDQRESLERDLKRALGNEHYVVAPPVTTLPEAIDYVMDHFVQPAKEGRWASLPNLVVLDWKLGDTRHPAYPQVRTGADLYLELVAPMQDGVLEIKTRVILVTAYMAGDEKTIMDALGPSYAARLRSCLERGLFDFWRKPVRAEAIRATIQVMFGLATRWDSCETINSWRHSLVNSDLDESLRKTLALPLFLGVSDCFRRVVTQARRLSNADRRLCIMLQGETGTGKELVARLIHDFEHVKKKTSGEWECDEAAGTFFGVNCAAFTEELLQAQLFGYAERAFTGATAARRGIFELADGGTVFLDEIGEAGPRFKAMLLRFLETRIVSPVGGEGAGTEVKVRVILATDRDLARELKKGKLTEAFYRRVAALQIALSPLRERREDIPVLAVKFWNEAYYQTYHTDAPGGAVDLENEESYTRAFTEAALWELQYRSEWPGNVRQLRSVIGSAVAIAGEGGAVPLGRAEIMEALGLTKEESPLTPLGLIGRLDDKALLERLRFVEDIWRALLHTYRPESDPKPPRRVKDVARVAHRALGDTNFWRQMKQPAKQEFIRRHADELPILDRYIKSLQKNKSS